MRYLHPVQKHEKFAASGRYRFFRDGQALQKTEAWTVHEHPDGETFVRIDADSRLEDGKSILVEALRDTANELVRFDVHYDNANFEGGIKALRVTYHRVEGRMQVGYALNGADREYVEMELPSATLVDMPLLVLRGRTLMKMAQAGDQAMSMFVPMFEHAQLFPGVRRAIQPRVEYVADDLVLLGRRQIETRRYRYLDRAVSYWIDRHGVVIKRVNTFKQQEFVVLISNYAQRHVPEICQSSDDKAVTSDG